MSGEVRSIDEWERRTVAGLLVRAIAMLGVEHPSPGLEALIEKGQEDYRPITTLDDPAAVLLDLAREADPEGEAADAEIVISLALLYASQEDLRGLHRDEAITKALAGRFGAAVPSALKSWLDQHAPA